MQSQELSKHLDIAMAAALAGGRAIMQVRDSGDLSFDQKSDLSPVTEADRRANEAICACLAKGEALPVLSEESKQVPFSERKSWPRFWLVDPLDGTKEYIRGSADFTVNIALIEEGAPVIGVIYAPVSDTLYYGGTTLGAYRRKANEHHALRIKSELGVPLKVVASLSHRSIETEELLSRLPEHELVAIGSSLKFCLVAEGSADLYPRLAPTMEWDTGAGHAIVEAAGAKVITADGQPLAYNKPNLKNPNFIATTPAAAQVLSSWS